MALLIIDNNDSFTYNLYHLVKMVSDIEIVVIPYEEITMQDWKNAEKVMISPGPGLPEDFPKYLKWFDEYADKKSILGICMGLELIGSYFGATLKRLENVQHGMKTIMKLTEVDDILFAGIEREFIGGLYHSWAIEREGIPDELEITCYSEDQQIMAIKHCCRDLRGIQFHPESYMTESGLTMMKNWLSY